MAKKSEPVNEPVVPVAAAPKPAAPAKKRFRVSLANPIPLGQNPMEIEADSAEHAKQQFMAANNISASTNPWTVDEL